MLKYNIRISPVGSDLNLTFPLSTKAHLGGLSQDIQDLVTDQSDESINSVTDGEKVRFTPQTNRDITFVNALSGFTLSEVKTQAYVNSFFILQVYDTPVSDTQELLHTSYINGYIFPTTGLTAKFVWSNQFEYGDIHIPADYLETFSGNTDNVYCKTNFYNAKTGKIHPFYNSNATGNTEQTLYQVITINKSAKTHDVVANMIFSAIINPDYTEIINDSIESFNVEKPTYPSGNTFNTNGTYTTI